MTAPDTDHAARIYRVLDHIEANELPVGTKIHSSITLGSCPADVDQIRRYTAALQRERDEAREALADERARVDRLQTYGLCIREELLTRYPEYADVENRVVQCAYLQPGDLPAEGEVPDATV